MEREEKSETQQWREVSAIYMPSPQPNSLSLAAHNTTEKAFFPQSPLPLISESPGNIQIHLSASVGLTLPFSFDGDGWGRERE